MKKSKKATKPTKNLLAWVIMGVVGLSILLGVVFLNQPQLLNSRASISGNFGSPTCDAPSFCATESQCYGQNGMVSTKSCGGANEFCCTKTYVCEGGAVPGACQTRNGSLQKCMANGLWAKATRSQCSSGTVENVSDPNVSKNFSYY